MSSSKYVVVRNKEKNFPIPFECITDQTTQRNNGFYRIKRLDHLEKNLNQIWFTSLFSFLCSSYGRESLMGIVKLPFWKHEKAV